MINPLCNTSFGTSYELFAINTRILDVANYKQPIVCLWLLMANVENRPTATAAQFLPVNIHKNRYLLAHRSHLSIQNDVNQACKHIQFTLLSGNRVQYYVHQVIILKKLNCLSVENGLGT